MRDGLCLIFNPCAVGNRTTKNMTTINNLLDLFSNAVLAAGTVNLAECLIETLKKSF